jgi:Transposase, Mutator family
MPTRTHDIEHADDSSTPGLGVFNPKETLNALLEAEADQICGAQRYERSAERVDTRAGHYERKLETKVGAVTLKMSKLRRLPFETAIIERCRRREESVEEALVEIYLAGVSVRRVEDITEALWGTRVSSGTVSRLNHTLFGGDSGVTGVLCLGVFGVNIATETVIERVFQLRCASSLNAGAR